MKLEAIGVSRGLRGGRKKPVKRREGNDALGPRKRILLKFRNRETAWLDTATKSNQDACRRPRGNWGKISYFHNVGVTCGMKLIREAGELAEEGV